MLAPKFLIRINYKSGRSEEFWTWKFTYKTTGVKITELNWIWAGGNKPVIVNLEEIESVWHVKTRYGLFLGDKSNL